MYKTFLVGLPVLTKILENRIKFGMNQYLCLLGCFFDYAGKLVMDRYLILHV